MKTRGIILEALDYAKANALITSGDYQNAKRDVLIAADVAERHDTMMKRYAEQVEVIRQAIDNDELSYEVKQFLGKLYLPTDYDRRTVSAERSNP